MDAPARIQVSEERLRQLFAEFKLELFRELEKYATAREVESLDQRVKTLELWQANQTGGTSERKTFWDGSFKWVTLLVTVLGVAVTFYWLNHP